MSELEDMSSVHEEIPEKGEIGRRAGGRVNESQTLTHVRPLSVCRT